MLTEPLGGSLATAGSSRLALLVAYNGAAFSGQCCACIQQCILFLCKHAQLMSMCHANLAGWSNVGTRATPSVSAKLEKVLHQIHGLPGDTGAGAAALDGASRTDAGVHALGQTALYTGIVMITCLSSCTFVPLHAQHEGYGVRQSITTTIRVDQRIVPQYR